MPTTRRRLAVQRHIVPMPIAKNTGVYQHKILVGTPTLGSVRIEFMNAVNGLVMPVNFQISNQTPIGYLVADAQNIIAHEAISRGFEWLFLLEDDVIVPLDTLIRLEEYMRKKDVPIVSGLYPLKSDVPQPFIFRGRGNGVFTDFKIGDRVWADGVPTGALLVHVSILKEMAKHVPQYSVRNSGQGVRLARIFESPRRAFVDSGTGAYQKVVGTSDLYFCDQLRELDILRKAGWKKIAAREFPYLVDTAINCGHIEREHGRIYRIGPRGDQLQ